MHKLVQALCLSLALAGCTDSATPARGKPTVLFLPGGAGSEWHTFLRQSGKNNDPLGVFRFEDEVLHVSGEDFGYIATTRPYRDFHLTLQFKWGEEKHAPRLQEKRNAGVLYHVDLYNGEKVWPRSLEFQIQEGDCGDFWMTDSTTIVHRGVPTPPQPSYRAVKFKNAEHPAGEWNMVEITVRDSITHTLNGELVNAASRGNTQEGLIVLQSEGAEIFYKNVVIRDLTPR